MKTNETNQQRVDRLENERIEISNAEREANNAQGNVAVRMADIIVARQRVKDLTLELAEAKAALPKREQRHKDAIRKAQTLSAKLAAMKAREEAR